MIKYLSIILFTVFTGCNKTPKQSISQYKWECLDVTVTAYNSLSYQTNSQPNITAFGDTLSPNLKCIAVSRDLLKLGLTYNTPVVIEGLEGIYLVKDKMHRRWRKRIDIYMGKDVKKAKQWGRQKLTINYQVKRDSLDIKKASN
ncbi:3D domain-containing protein [Mangrovimonas cancribranchiae]|uniref:3D domain-containing protein n=1 Tax=Mangrovimonas cancribranchiae TaxID=3080055 RepID=UPI0038620CFE